MLLCALTGAPVPPSAWRQGAQPGPAGSGEHLGAGTRHPATMDESGGRAGRHIAAELLMEWVRNLSYNNGKQKLSKLLWETWRINRLKSSFQ